MTYAERLECYQQNVKEYPAIAGALADKLGVSAASLIAIGIGWMPEEASWVFPERNGEGQVVGLMKRRKNGSKLVEQKSSRGLTYELNPMYQPGQQEYSSGAHNWVRCTAEYPCPICDREDWCLVSSENPTDPQAVICGKTAAGAWKSVGEAGYLHVRKEEGYLLNTGGPVLPLSEHPVLIVEGQTDAAAAITLGFQTIGRPSASGGLRHLVPVIAGRDVVIIGENDSGAGRLGMEKTFETIKTEAASALKLMPPEGIKDLRAWVSRGLTTEGLLTIIAEQGVAHSSANLLAPSAPMDIAERWLQERHWLDGIPILRLYAEEWYRFDGTKYVPMKGRDFVRGDVYSFLRGKTYKKFTAQSGLTIQPYEATARKVSDILDASLETCPLDGDAPLWLGGDEGRPDIRSIIGFTNGLLEVPRLTLHPPTPALFSLSALPYGWDPEARCPLWIRFLHEIFPGDGEKRLLLQEWFGYNMVADTSQEKLMFFLGRPGAGKGTVIAALKAVLGERQVADTDFDMLTDQFGLSQLIGTLAAILPDAHMTRWSNPAKALEVLKKISGRDGVGINRKHKSILRSYQLSCRFTISVNAMPDLPDHERSLDRRLLLLHFGECFTGREDFDLKEKLVAEAPGIAAWAVRGLLRLRDRGFTMPTSSEPVVEAFLKQSSPVTEFVAEHCMFVDVVFPAGMMYDAFFRWCKEQGLGAGTRARFLQRFSLLYPGCHVKKTEYNGEMLRCLTNVRLTPTAIKQFLVNPQR